MYSVNVEGYPFDPASVCVINLQGVSDGKMKVLVKSTSTDWAKQGEAFEFLESVAKVLNHPPSEEFRVLLLESITEVCLANERRKNSVETSEGQRWLNRLRFSKGGVSDE